MAAKTISAELKGGDALERHLRGIAKKLGKGATVAVGFLESETYPGGVHHWTPAQLKKMTAGKGLAQFLNGKKKYSGPVAQVAFWMEFGTKSAGQKAKEAAGMGGTGGRKQWMSPPRPFMRHTVAMKSPRWGNALGAALKATKYDARAALAMLGEKIQGQMRESIQNWADPSNTEVTVDLKGFNKPLVNSGVMMRAVDYQVLDGE